MHNHSNKYTNRNFLRGNYFLKGILTLIVNFCFLISYSQLQQDIQTPKIVPPSPDAAALGKYGEIPVDKSTGIPDISIPIYEIKTPRFNIPISLSYHASGVKVDEISSWVGCGWILNAGGTITRSIVGFPDDGALGILNNTMIKASSIVLTRDYNYIANALNKRLDTEPDNFFYNFNGHAGSFEFGYDKIPVLVPYKPIKITFSTSTGFDIIDEHGNKYNFNTKENVTSSININMTGTSSWYLTQMVSADLSDTVKFIYQTDGSVTTDFSPNFSQNISQDYSPYTLGTITRLQPIIKTTPTRQFNVVRIKSILFKGGKLDFIAKGGRLDDGIMSLDSIIVSNQDASTNQYARLKSAKLLTDYFYSTLPIPTGLVYTEASKHRLKLSGFQENDKNNIIVDSFHFDYNTGILPAVHSFAQDKWGYFNGKTQNLTLLESQNVVIYPTSAADPIMDVVGGTQGADRSVSPSDLQAGVLTKIVYPTKGYTVFAYENNMQEGIATVQGSSQSAAIGLHQETVTQPYMPTSNMLQTGGNIFHVQLRKGSDNPTYPLATAKIVRVSDGNIMYTITADPTNNIDKIVVVQLSSDIPYQMVTVAHGGDGLTSSTLPYAILTTTFQVPSGSNLVNASGLRINSIKNYNSDGTIINTETYKYGNNESGGGMILTPYTTYHYNQTNLYLTTTAYCGDQSNYAFQIAPVIVYSNNAVYPLGSLNGSPIAYPTVTLYKGDPQQNIGKSVFKYNIYTDSLFVPGSAYSNGFKPVPVTWKNGEPIWEGHYQNNGNGQYSLVKEVSNSFDLVGRKNGVGTIFGYPHEPMGYSYDNPILNGGQVQTVSGCLTYTWTPLNFYWFDYPISAGSRILRQTITTSYGTDGISKFVDTTKYYYDNMDHVFPTRIVKSNSKGDSLVKMLHYPQDMVNAGNDPTGIYASMSSANILSPVIENLDFKNTTQLLKLKTNYAKFNNLIIKPQSEEAQNGSYPSEIKLKYLNYDSRGNLLRVLGEDGLPISYIWDYQYAFPIAKVLDSVQSDEAFTSFEADGTGNWIIPSTLRDTFYLTGTKSYNLTKGAISKSGLSIGKIYIISFWSKSATYSISGGTNVITTGKSSGLWTYKENKIAATSTTVVLSGSGDLDELRLYPLGSQMSSYTYTPLVGETTINDPNSEMTFYEYDAFIRLRNIKDYQGNIIKNFQYNYAQGCTLCSIPMKTFTQTGTISYPVGVFSVANKLLGNATTPAQYISLWNADANNHAIGLLAAGSDSMHFNLTVNSGQTSPGYVTGCRYYQYDLPYTQFDGARNANGVYVDFGDGAGMFLGKTATDTLVTKAPNTFNPNFGYSVYWVHNYPNSNVKTVTFYHNDGGEAMNLDNYYIPANSLMLVRNLRGNLPQNTPSFGGNVFQQASANSISGITNWNVLSGITDFSMTTGDYTNPCLNVSYPQDFMANNRNLNTITTTRGYYLEGYEDASFKLNKLKTNWNTYFNNLSSITICDDHWNREDLGYLLRLNRFGLVAGNQNHSFNQTNNPLVPIPVSVIDNIIIQIAAGAGRSVTNGTINIFSAGTTRSSTSDNSFNILKSKGWTIIINGITL